MTTCGFCHGTGVVATPAYDNEGRADAGPETRTCGGVYAIRHIASSKSYVGSTANIPKRWGEHRGRLARGTHSNRHLQSAWDRYGAAAFVFEIIEPVERKEDLICAEQRHIDRLQAWRRGCGYNVKAKADSPLGVKRSPETRARMSASAKNRTPELKARHAERLASYSRSPEARARLAERNQTLASRARLSARDVSPETRAKLVEANRNRSPEVRARVAEAIRISNQSPEHRAMLSNFAKNRSPEYRAKLSEGNRRRSPEIVAKFRAAAWSPEARAKRAATRQAKLHCDGSGECDGGERLLPALTHEPRSRGLAAWM